MSSLVSLRSLVSTQIAFLLSLLATASFAAPLARAHDETQNQPPAAGEEARYLGMPTGYWIGKLSAENAAARRQAIEALAAIGPEAEKAVPALVKALEDEDVDVRLAALEALGQIGPKARQASPVLARAIKDKNVKFSRKAVVAAGKIKADDNDVVQALISQLPNFGYEGLGPDALDALRSIGPKAVKSAFPVLVMLFKRGPAQINVSNVSSVTPPATSPGLPTSFMNSICVALLETGDQALPVFLDGLKSDNPSVQKYAVQALRPYGSKANAAIAILADELKKCDIPQEVTFPTGYIPDDFGECGVLYLVSRGSPAETALVDLIGTERTGDWVSRTLARNHAKAAVPALVSAVKQGPSKQRIRAANALSRIGADAKDAIPALQEMARADDVEIRQAAQSALQAINAAKKE